MLKYMRGHLGQKVLLLVVIGIAFVFVLWGVFPESKSGSTGSLRGSDTDVASIGSERITLSELQNAVGREMETYRSMGMDIPPEMAANIRMGALEKLVSQKLMLVEAQRLGIGASDQEVMEEIQKYPVFQDKTTKGFSTELYKQVLAANQLTPGSFEANVKESLTNQHVIQFIEARIRVTPVEVEREYQISNETRDISFVKYAREDAMKEMKVDEAELNKFLADKNKEVAINNYYAQNNMRYNKPEQVCARHILKRFAPGMKQEEAAKAGPPKAFLSIKPTAANFAAVAKKESDDPGSKKNGGDLECFGKGAMDKAFESAAFSLPLNSVSAPVLSQFGWHYIMVYKKTPGVSQSLDKVKREIAADLIKRDRMDEIRKINLAQGERAAKSWPPKDRTPESTGSFNGLEGFIPKIGRADEILAAAFDPKAKMQNEPQVFEAQGSVIVAKVKERSSADMKKFNQDREVQIKSLRERKLRAFLPAWMEDVKSRVKISYNNKIMGSS